MRATGTTTNSSTSIAKTQTCLPALSHSRARAKLVVLRSAVLSPSCSTSSASSSSVVVVDDDSVTVTVTVWCVVGVVVVVGDVVTNLAGAASCHSAAASNTTAFTHTMKLVANANIHTSLAAAAAQLCG